MPELPEVETVRDGLARHVVGARVREVEVLRDYSVRRHDGGPEAFASAMEGATLAASARRGKYLWLPLTPPSPVAAPVETTRQRAAGAAATRPTAGTALLAHLGMSGQLLVRDGRDPWVHPHLRVRLHLEDAPTGATALDFVDQRTFGHLSVADLVPTPDGAPGGLGTDEPAVPGPVAHIARDLLDPVVAPGTPGRAALVAAIRRRRTVVKRALLDQTLVSGVGNIYADEALWRARLHYARATDALRPTDVARVLDAAEEVMREALAVGGTSFDALYVNVNGESGYFARGLAAYGREGEPCPRCGTPIRREAFMNRSSHFCPRCQRRR
ncbi:bifunctional DNA-formamidopyrimidine glycosylase/DNA-(apurinic or apyrimidinic site) lyase [Xylanimonas protaetiae]|uniref:Bifunctional DNA-formamidopyrimidine glycosylase/DNA-(Apurinic or apyrimidinic site) lyase n=1 Tax=Xylanimonas protaetiae TaxID=2509457 RepID=A0A4P6F7V3_9MICO|nr:bifunctional DNA-formamidopyrimidine glycosylase/DNA-(apurinic or apyrimidinic site) lyase [Xylanimonas protaetiae]QAY71556.1 bifunctional DNA-formamidopyrimidine glycosylase/DNA-(apurinic or apyrimidinic site) lyase [Xylanimonas protaetiae]